MENNEERRINYLKLGIIVFLIVICILLLMCRLVVIHIKYDIDGNPIDYKAETVPFIGVGDGCESCFGYGKNLESEKTFVGFDPWGGTKFYVDDVCHINGVFSQFWYTLDFSENGPKFCNRTVYVHMSYDDNGILQYDVDCDNSKSVQIQGDADYVRCKIIL